MIADTVCVGYRKLASKWPNHTDKSCRMLRPEGWGVWVDLSELLAVERGFVLVFVFDIAGSCNPASQ